LTNNTLRGHNRALLIKMKTLTLLCLTCALFSVSILLLPIGAVNPPKVGVKKGDWIEYSMTIAGTPLLDGARNLTSYRTEVLATSDTSIRVNKTATSVNGTHTSSIWNFSFHEGRVPGWAFIPANLSVGETFFDYNMTANVVVEGEAQKMLLCVDRTVTHASVSGVVYKEWDKATGVYVYAVEHTTSYTVTTEVTATNLWSPEPQEQNLTPTTELILASAVATALALTAIALIYWRKRLVKKV
jgi:hypothetical protein